MMRIAVSGAACGRQASHTPNVVSPVTDPARNAVVRKSSCGEGAMISVSTPAAASATALTRPAGPPTMTAASAVLMLCALFTSRLGIHQGNLQVKPPRTTFSVNATAEPVALPQFAAVEQEAAARSTKRYSAFALQFPKNANSTRAPAAQPSLVAVSNVDGGLRPV